ncbi:MAG: PEGA domain-containing protein [Ignavibacteriaceae bacterium]
MKNILYLIIILLFTRCETNPPSTPEDVHKDFGKLFINSNVTGARIFLNDVNTGKFSPDTISAEVGSHIVKLELDGFATTSQPVDVFKDSTVTVTFTLQEIVNKLVLLEDFANVSCVPCVNNNKIVKQLVEESYGTSKLVAIKYPINFPKPDDPFYIANKPDSDARRQFYGPINIAPTTFTDGAYTLSGDSISIKEKIDAQLLKPAQFKIEVADSIAGNVYMIKVKVTLIDQANIDFTNLILHTVVTETEIEFATPPGSNGETKFYDVMRAMLPSNQGESLDLLQQNAEMNFELQTTISTGWNQVHLNTVVFIQNKQTKEVYQANSTF